MVPYVMLKGLHCPPTNIKEPTTSLHRRVTLQDRLYTKRERTLGGFAMAQARDAGSLYEDGTGSENTKEPLHSGDKSRVSGDQDSRSVIRSQIYNI